MKIFLCSTSFDLEDLRALAVDRFGEKHEFIHFEDAAFPSRRGLHSHDQCIAAVKQADVIVCIIDRRYGGRYRGQRNADFPEQSVKFRGWISGLEQTVEVKIPTQDLSISWCELIAAYRADKYVITFARKRTMDEKATRRKNQGVIDFKSAHVEDVRIFDLLDWITKQSKDNWIIPFDNAVDFLKKLEKWLAVADDSMVIPAEHEAAAHRPVTVIVEGDTDADVVKVLAKKYVINRPISIVIAQGKRALLGGLNVYTHAFKNSAGIIFLADADTNDSEEIEIQKNQFRKIISESERPDAKLILIAPEIEIWLGKTEFKRNQPRHFNRLFEELYHLQEEAEMRRESIPSLNEFIKALEALDTKP